MENFKKTISDHLNWRTGSIWSFWMCLNILLCLFSALLLYLCYLLRQKSPCEGEGSKSLKRIPYVFFHMPLPTIASGHTGPLRGPRPHKIRFGQWGCEPLVPIHNPAVQLSVMLYHQTDSNARSKLTINILCIYEYVSKKWGCAKDQVEDWIGINL